MRSLDRFYYNAARALPLFASVLLCYFPATSDMAAEGQEYIRRYLLFLIAFGLWKIVRALVPAPTAVPVQSASGKASEPVSKGKSKKGTDKSAVPAKGSRWRPLVQALMCFALVVFLQQIKENMGAPFFYIAIAAMFFSGVELLLRRKKFFLGSIFALFLSATLTGFLSFKIVGFTKLVSVVVFNIALACAVAANLTALLIADGEVPRTGLGWLRKQRKANAIQLGTLAMVSRGRFALVFSILTLLAPTLVVGLHILGPFQRMYCFVYLTLPFIAQLTASAQNRGPEDPQEASFLRMSTGISLLFAAIILCVSLLLL